MPRRLILDCDPGQDDAVSLLLAMASPEAFEIVGITAVAGNVPLPLTARNACIVRDLAGRSDLPVYAGSARPLRRELVTAENVHGASGLRGIEIVPPRRPPEDRHAVDFLVEILRGAAPASITLVATGPLTNVATAIERDRKILTGVAEIVLMGGASREGGNYSPSAEFNMLVDPDAARIVLDCGAPITMVGLDATCQANLTPARIARIAALDNPVARITAAMLEQHGQLDRPRFAGSGVPLHDPCTIAFLLAPELFTGRRCNVAVETESELTLGHTAVDFWYVTERPPNVNWIHGVDAEGFYALLADRLARFGRTV